MGDPEIVRQCQELYGKHKRALDLIYKYRPDYQAQIRPVVEDLIRQQHPRLRPDASKKDNIKFVGQTWDTRTLRRSREWTESGRMLMFEVHNDSDSLSLHLYLGPGPQEIRLRVLDMARVNPEVFVVPRSLSSKWLPIFSRHLLREEAYADLDEKERNEEIRRRWNQFIEEDLPRIEAALKKETWIWDPVEADG